MKCLKSFYIAHRGLFENSGDAPENTILAFKKAVNAGYGIELDVQITKDKRIVVAHDYDLKRICGEDILIKDLTYQELRKYKVLNSNESIPLLEDALGVINGKVPLIVEIKTESDYKEVTMLTSKILSSYSGLYCVESFSPFVIGWYKKNNPKIIRGQLADDLVQKKHFKSHFKNWILTNMVFNLFYKPDFIAYNHEYGGNKCIRFWKRLLGCSLAAWTIRSQEELERAAEKFDIFIFDGFLPAVKTGTEH
ncbi:MAG: hypothetical protein FWC97_08285 [Treponema sp.]|nr:hypothetical protein [Treponema sp.]